MKITQCPNKFQFKLINGEIPPGKTVLKTLNFPSENRINSNCQRPECWNKDLPIFNCLTSVPSINT